MRPPNCRYLATGHISALASPAIGFMVQEYAHSFTAWALHCKANPLALDYGHVNLDNLLFH